MNRVNPASAIAFGVTLILSVALLWLFPGLMQHTWLAALLIAVVLIGAHYQSRWASAVQAAFAGILLAILIVFGISTAQMIRGWIAQPPEWDYFTFWLDGRVASQGLNFYDAANYQRIAQPFYLDREFTQEIVDVGFRYPPQTMFLFVPLGWFSVSTSALLWYGFEGLVLLLDIFLLWKIFFDGRNLSNLALIAALVLLFPPTIFNLRDAQTNSLLLLTLLMFWHERKLPRSGIWLALGIIVKPYLALLLIYVLVLRQWRMFIWSLGTLAVVSLLSMFTFGFQTFVSYFTANPVAKLPSWYFSELANGSLYAILWRAFGGSALVEPIFIVVALVLTGLTAWLVNRLGVGRSEWALSAILALALLIYPNTGTSYCIVLLASFLLLWTNREKLPGGTWSVAAFAASEALLLNYQYGASNFVFVAILLNWLTLIAASVWSVYANFKYPVTASIAREGELIEASQ